MVGMPGLKAVINFALRESQAEDGDEGEVGEQSEKSIRMSIDNNDVEHNKDILAGFGIGVTPSVSIDDDLSDNEIVSTPSYKKPLGLTIDIDQANSNVPVSETPILGDDLIVEVESEEDDIPDKYHDYAGSDY